MSIFWEAVRSPYKRLRALRCRRGLSQVERRRRLMMGSILFGYSMTWLLIMQPISIPISVLISLSHIAELAWAM